MPLSGGEVVRLWFLQAAVLQKKGAPGRGAITKSTLSDRRLVYIEAGLLSAQLVERGTSSHATALKAAKAAMSTKSGKSTAISSQ
mmetsp:Transcript_29598/g.76457  ORF Transcript_29598/g.76457 Transcript_29598/m.76457 type:complete len:85 (-) Transcript_29598:103-357(-)